MPFTLPTFNLTCKLFTSEDITAPPRVSTACNLAWGRRTGLPTVGSDPIGDVVDFPGSMTLLLPPGTDIRDVLSSTGRDAVEVPGGSGRFYFVLCVDDIGKGFANEHRGAQITKRGGLTGFWPTPLP